MKLYTLILAALLGGCSLFGPSYAPVDPPKFPEATETLKQKCKELQELDPNKSNNITDILKSVVQNYGLYHECSLRVDGWNKWYTEQRKIYEEAVEKGKSKQ